MERTTKSGAASLGLALALALAWPSPAEAEIVVEEACGGRGFTGVLDSPGGHETIHFTSCVTPDGARSVISNGRLEPMTVVEYDRRTESVRYWASGIDLTAVDATDLELQLVGETFARSEARLVARLVPALVESGLDRSSLPVRMMIANTLGYALRPMTAIEPPCDDCECFGCCGLGCAGCTDCWTSDCLLHDLCVRSRGGGIIAHLRCFDLLQPALISIVLDC
jgi:hypothetical protein